MKTFWFLHGLFLAVVALGTSGCLTHSSSETQYTPSPDGQWIISEKSTQLAWVGDPPKSIKASLRLVIRDANGGAIRKESWYNGKDSEGVNEFLWSPDSHKVAVRWGLQSILEVYDVGTRHRTNVHGSAAAMRQFETNLNSFPFASAGSFRWLDATNIVFVVEAPRQLSVIRTSCNGGARQVLFNGNSPDIGSSLRASISPDCKTVVFLTGDKIVAVDLTDTNLLKTWPHLGAPVAFSWTKNNERCLIHTFVEAPKRGDQSSRNYQSVIFLYERVTGELVNLTTLLHSVDEGAEFCGPFFETGVWSADGKWFSIWSQPATPNRTNYASRQWICQVKPWSVARTEDSLGSGYYNVGFAPAGNLVALTKENQNQPEEKALYVAEISTNPQGLPTLSQPRLITSLHGTTSWFWSADGADIITFNIFGFTRHPVKPDH